VQNCINTQNANFDKEDWDRWLHSINVYFSTYKLDTILQTKPIDDCRPYATVKVNGLEVMGLLDSGSAVTILGGNAYKVFVRDKLPLQKDLCISLTAAGGQALKSLGYINLPITFENQFHIIKAHVVPDVNTDLILGIDFWRQFKILPKHLDSITLTSNVPHIDSLMTDALSHVHGYDNLSSSEKSLADDVIAQFEQISSEQKGLGVTTLTTHRIDTGDALPIRQRYYRMSPEKQRVLVEQVDEMLALDVIEPCESEWSSPVLIVNKKDGSPRFCLDSRKLNSVTKKDAYNLPYISEILDNLRDARYLSSIDLSKAFWQIPIAEEDRDKTGFYVPSRGTYRFKRTAFGLTNAPATQQRLVDILFREFDLKVFAYLDDIIIVSQDFNSHVSLLLRVLEKLKQANLTINLKKSEFFRTQLRYLGYVVDSGGLRTDPEKVEAILNYPTPSSRKDIKRFLGTATWYRRFVPNFSTIAGPLNRLTSSKKGGPPFKWTPEADAAFLKLKECLVTAPVLSCPDYSKSFEVHTDASNYGVGAMLTQSIDGKEHPIAYMSRSLTPAEKNFSITEREALAVIVALEHWRCYLENGQPFTVFTDHSALKWFLSINNPTGRLARWGVRLSAFNFELKHRRGVDNVIPDALSRAVPVHAISTSNWYLKSSDSWYKSIYNSCLTRPENYLNYLIKNNSLYRLCKNKHELTDEFSWKEVVPKELRESIIRENHSEPVAGHLGIYKTYRRLALRFYWPGMHQDVVRFVSSCEKCLSYKPQNHQTLGEMGRPKQCSRPFQMVSVDLMGPLPVTRKQNSFILVITCCFSKYCLIFPIRNATSAIVTKIMEDSLFLEHGVPQTIFLDNGSQFVSNMTQGLFKRYNVPNVFFTPKYSPQINSVERYNRTIITCISTFVDEDHRSWDLFIPKVRFAINNSVNEATGFTPSFLVYGRELVTCGSHYLDNNLGDEVSFLPREVYAENLGCLAEIFNTVQAKLWHAHSKNASHYNLRRKSSEFNVGDIVMKRTYLLSNKDKYFSKKLAPKFIKCKIVDKKSPLVYVLENMAGKNIGTWHIKDLKLVGLNK
jgi:transposase InsO family protein